MNSSGCPCPCPRPDPSPCHPSLLIFFLALSFIEFVVILIIVLARKSSNKRNSLTHTTTHYRRAPIQTQPRPDVFAELQRQADVREYRPLSQNIRRSALELLPLPADGPISPPTNGRDAIPLTHGATIEGPSFSGSHTNYRPDIIAVKRVEPPIPEIVSLSTSSSSLSSDRPESQNGTPPVPEIARIPSPKKPRQQTARRRSLPRPPLNS